MPRGPRRLRRRSRRLRRAGPPPRGRLPGRQPRPGGPRRPPAGGVLQRRGAGRALDPGDDLRRDPGLPATRSSRRTSTRRSASTTPARAIRSGNTSSPRCRPSCAWTPRRHRVCLVGHSHVALSFSRSPGRVRHRADPGGRRGARADQRRVADQPRQRRPAPRRRSRGPPGSSSTPAPGRPSTAGPSTTSPAPPRRSAPPGCRIRWPSGCTTANRRCAWTRPNLLPTGQVSKVTPRMRYVLRALLAGGLGLRRGFPRRLWRRLRPALNRPGQRPQQPSSIRCPAP